MKNAPLRLVIAISTIPNSRSRRLRLSCRHEVILYRAKYPNYIHCEECGNSGRFVDDSRRNASMMSRGNGKNPWSKNNK